jgi:hypothetical protein
MCHAPSNGGRAGARGVIIFQEIDFLQNSFFFYKERPRIGRFLNRAICIWNSQIKMF